MLSVALKGTSHRKWANATVSMFARLTTCPPEPMTVDREGDIAGGS